MMLSPTWSTWDCSAVGMVSIRPERWLGVHRKPSHFQQHRTKPRARSLVDADTGQHIANVRSIERTATGVRIAGKSFELLARWAPLSSGLSVSGEHDVTPTYAAVVYRMRSMLALHCQRCLANSARMPYGYSTPGPCNCHDVAWSLAQHGDCRALGASGVEAKAVLLLRLWNVSEMRCSTR